MDDMKGAARNLKKKNDKVWQAGVVDGLVPLGDKRQNKKKQDEEGRRRRGIEEE